MIPVIRIVKNDWRILDYCPPCVLAMVRGETHRNILTLYAILCRISVPVDGKFHDGATALPMLGGSLPRQSLQGRDDIGFPDANDQVGGGRAGPASQVQGISGMVEKVLETAQLFDVRPLDSCDEDSILQIVSIDQASGPLGERTVTVGLEILDQRTWLVDANGKPELSEIAHRVDSPPSFRSSEQAEHARFRGNRSCGALTVPAVKTPRL